MYLYYISYANTFLMYRYWTRLSEFFFSIYTIKQWVINIQSIAVPLFFVINGYLILGKKRDEKYIIQKSLKLFLQLLFFFLF